MSRHHCAQEKATLASVSFGLCWAAWHNQKTAAPKALCIHIKMFPIHLYHSLSLISVITGMVKGCSGDVHSQISEWAADHITVWCCHNASFQQFQVLFSCQFLTHGKAEALCSQLLFLVSFWTWSQNSCMCCTPNHGKAMIMLCHLWNICEKISCKPFIISRFETSLRQSKKHEVEEEQSFLCIWVQNRAALAFPIW